GRARRQLLPRIHAQRDGERVPLPPHLRQLDIVRGRVELDHLDVPVEPVEHGARRAHHGPDAEPGEASATGASAPTNAGRPASAAPAVGCAGAGAVAATSTPGWSHRARVGPPALAAGSSRGSSGEQAGCVATTTSTRSPSDAQASRGPTRA